jgi:poly-gamma-glutamate capsule biosynthesis protein CapA/YwtB (metallophosphatase superfamily)
MATIRPVPWSRRRALSALAAAPLSLSGCRDRGPFRTHTALFCGDFILGRHLNLALRDPATRVRVLGDLEAVLSRVDLVIANAEGVISGGGAFEDKGESRPYLYRAHPDAIELIREAGIDLLTVGNNHAGDYGRAALLEMLDRISAAGLGYAGAGTNLEDALTPVYRRIDDTVVALVGADLTYTKRYAANADSAGTLYLGEPSEKRNGRIVDTLARVLERARAHAHVVVFSPHWGKGMATEPTPAMRTLASALIEAGYDGIFGHSSHIYQGVEIIAGKPVVYDSGNFVVDWEPEDENHRAFVWEASFDRRGFGSLIGRPLRLRENHTAVAENEVGAELLETLRDRSLALGSKVELIHGTARLDLDPGEEHSPPTQAGLPLRTPPVTIREAPNDTVLEHLPTDASAVDVAYSAGVRIRGYHTVVPTLRVPKASQVVILYLEAERIPDREIYVRVGHRRAFSTDEIVSPFGDHLPGDWLLPVSAFPLGKIVQDWSLVRMMVQPKGRYEVLVALGEQLETGSPLVPSESNVELVDGAWLRVGVFEFREGAPRFFESLGPYRASRSLEPANHSGRW